jgi:putative peptidoglycan lipid II flippase
MAFHRSIATVSLLTLLSRLLGFLRDLLMAVLLGAGPGADAFVVAQRIPNAFRSIFAEGAMDSAFVPIYARKQKEDTAENAAAFVNHIFTILVLVLLPLTLLEVIFMAPIVEVLAPGFSLDGERLTLAVSYSRIAFGFLFLISVTALQGGLLNAHRHFAPLAMAPALLNTIMIGGFVVALISGWDGGLCASWSMIVGGVVQMLTLQIYCRRYGLRFRLSRPRWTADLKHFFKLVGPGVIGTGADQVNILVSAMFASSLPAGAVAALYYADRLNQLPLGVVGGAIATVLLPVLSHHIAAKENDAVIGHFSRAIEMALLLCFPASLILVLAAFPIVRILFQHGAFDASNTQITAETIIGYAFAIPGEVFVRIFTTKFYAHQDTKTPVIVGLISITLNAVFAWFFRSHWQHIGIAAGFALAMAATAFLLGFLLYLRGQAKLDREAKRRLPLLLVSILLMGLAFGLSAAPAKHISQFFFTTGFCADCMALALRLLLSGSLYLIVLHVTGAARLNQFKALLKRS